MNHIKFINLVYGDDLPRGFMKFKFNSKFKNPSTIRRVLYTTKEVHEFCKDGADLFCTVFSDRTRTEKIYDIIFLDIDNYKYLMPILQILNEQNIKSYIIINTGYKGYHIYFKIKPIYLDNYGYAIKQWMRKVRLLPYVDPKVIEHHRLMRVPYCIRTNVKPHKYVPVIDVQGKLVLPDDIKFNVNTPKTPILNISYSHNNNDTTINTEFNKTMPPCMQQIYDNCIAGKDLNYAEYYQLLVYMCRTSTYQNIMSTFSKCANYNERELQYHYNKFIQNKHQNYSCNNMLYNGLCPIRCPIYPSINHYVGGKDDV